MITTCTDCGALYEAGSEEQAYELQRWCVPCRRVRGIAAPLTDVGAHSPASDLSPPRADQTAPDDGSAP